jgi:phosphomannomutase
VTTPGPEASKQEWRAWAQAALAELEDVDVAAHFEVWAGLKPHTRVLLYDPLPGEPDPGPIQERCRAYLTRTPESGGLTIHPFDSPRERNRLGFSQPAAGAEQVDPNVIDVVLVPGLAFDRTGVRLGRGSGHYDRLLAQMRPDAIVVGVAPTRVVVPRLPREPHDRQMTHLATERGIVETDREDLLSAALAWMAGDPDPETRAQLQELIDTGDASVLAGPMGTPLRFGTAGIRGPVGPGPGRMNRAVVIRTTRGLADYLQARDRGDGTVVVGFDGRTDSRRFAADTIGVLRAAGIPTRHFAGTEPTPLVAHAALHMGATAAVVVTASHNPPADNGYKVYDANGAQIIPPVDTDIAEAIDAVGPAVDVPRYEMDLGAQSLDGAEIEDAYVSEVLDYRGSPSWEDTIPIVYTPLHGVSGSLAVRLLAEAGHTDVTPVPEQFSPDGAFPTVAFPNPEEPEALEMAEALAAARGAALVVANDPDGDRLAVAVPSGDGWRRLTGNEIGVLLGDYVLERTSGPGRLVVSSIVSSPMLGAIAADHGASFEVTLTGFKWICNAALALEADGKAFVFGYEEALGYTVGPVVRDKDGMSAAVWFADLVAEGAGRGETVIDRLERLHRKHGLWVSHPHSVTLTGELGREVIAAAIDALATDPPGNVGGLSVVHVTDFRVGAEHRPPWLPVHPLVEMALEGGSRVLVRPSGTEPKLKIYADVHRTAGEDPIPAEEAATATARRCVQDVLARLGLA